MRITGWRFVFLFMFWLGSMIVTAQFAIKETKERQVQLALIKSEIELVADPLPDSEKSHPLDTGCCMQAINACVDELLYIEAELEECKSRIVLAEEGE